MAVLYISEFASIGKGGTDQEQVLPQPSLADQVVAIGVGSLSSAAFGANTKLVLLSADAVCSVKFGLTAVASAVTVNNLRIPANTPMPFAVAPGMFVSVIANT